MVQYMTQRGVRRYDVVGEWVVRGVGEIVGQVVLLQKGGGDHGCHHGCSLRDLTFVVSLRKLAFVFSLSNETGHTGFKLSYKDSCNQTKQRKVPTELLKR